MKKLLFPLLPLMLMLLYACQREASLQTVVEQCDGKVAEYVDEFNVADDELYQQLFPNNVAGQFMHENIPLFDGKRVAHSRTYATRPIHIKQ